jgi:uridylate kinase
VARYRRVVYKLSGEYFAAGACMAADRFAKVCRSIELLVGLGVETCVVVGGGNIFRGNQCEEYGIDGVDADIVGMMATAVNAQMLFSMLTARGEVSPTILSNGPCSSLGQKWTPTGARGALERGTVPLVAGGCGQPLVSTDYPAVAFAKEIGAQAVLMAKNGIDGVYTRDPNTFHDATFLPKFSLKEALNSEIQVMDRVALQTALDQRLRIHVFSADDENLPSRIVKGEEHGTYLYP